MDSCESSILFLNVTSRVTQGMISTLNWWRSVKKCPPKGFCNLILTMLKTHLLGSWFCGRCFVSVQRLTEHHFVQAGQQCAAAQDKFGHKKSYSIALVQHRLALGTQLQIKDHFRKHALVPWHLGGEECWAFVYARVISFLRQKISIPCKIFFERCYAVEVMEYQQHNESCRRIAQEQDHAQNMP